MSKDRWQLWSFIVFVVAIILFFSVKECLPEGSIEVKFKGVVTADEQGGHYPICYGSFYSDIKIQEIMYDPNSTLSLNETVTICYVEELSLKIGDQVECYGVDCRNCLCGKQFTGKIKCFGDSYYSIPEFPSLLILPLLIIATSLVTVLYRKREKPIKP